MEFVYEEQLLANAGSKEQAQANASQDSNLKHDDKTDQVFQDFEEVVTKQYEKTTKALKNLVQDEEDGYHINLPLNEDVSEKAQQYLEKLDSNLQHVENVAQNYWSKVSAPSFWSTVTSSLGSKLERVVQVAEESPVSSSKNKVLPGGNRTEAELRLLSTERNVYTKKDLTLDAGFDVESKTEEIADFLEKDKELSQLMNELVPTEVSYKDFWNIYYTQRTRILEMENKRKKLLEAKEEKAEETATAGWDDDDDDDEDRDDDTEKPVIISKEEAMEGERVPDADTRNTNTKDDYKDNDNEEDADDDWE